MAVEIKAYYDSSMSAGGERITLASYIATTACWANFEQRWARVLAGDGNRPACRYLHMKELQRLDGEFSRTKGWDKKTRGLLLRDLNNLCFSPISRVDFAEQFVGAVCTVELAHYRTARHVAPALSRRTPEQVCLDHVLHVAIAMLPRDPSDPLRRTGSAELFFDRGEPYFKYVDRHWRKPYHRRPPMLQPVSKLDQVEMKSSPGVQAADFLAWATNRDFSARDKKFNMMRCLTAPLLGIRLDYQKLVQRYS